MAPEYAKALGISLRYSALLAVGLWSLGVVVPLLWIVVALTYASLSLSIVVRASADSQALGLMALALIVAVGLGLGLGAHVLLLPLMAKAAPSGFVWRMLP